MKDSGKQKRGCKPVTPQQREARKRYRREYYEKHKDELEFKRKMLEYQKRRYSQNPRFRRMQLDRSKEWRTNNHSYDMARKTVESWDLSEEQIKKQRATKRAWRDRLSPEARDKIKREQVKRASAWAKKQWNDPEYGWAFRLMQSKSKSVSQERKDAARAFYNEAMARRKAQKRADRMGSLLEGCTQEQKRIILGRAAEKGLSMRFPKTKTKGKRGKRR